MGSTAGGAEAEKEQLVAKRKRAAESVLLSQQYVQLMTVLLWMSCMPLFQHSPHSDIAKHENEILIIVFVHKYFLQGSSKAISGWHERTRARTDAGHAA